MERLADADLTWLKRRRGRRALSAILWVTGTPLARSRRAALWPVYAAARLSGLSAAALSSQFGLAEATCLHKDRVIAKIMQEWWPALHTWWEPHYERKDLTFTQSVAAEAEQF